MAKNKTPETKSPKGAMNKAAGTTRQGKPAFIIPPSRDTENSLTTHTREDIQKDIDAFIAAGNEVEEIKPGISGETSMRVSETIIYDDKYTIKETEEALRVQTGLDR